MTISRAIPYLTLVASMVLFLTIKWGNDKPQKLQTSLKAEVPVNEPLDSIIPPVQDSIPDDEYERFKKLGTPAYLPVQVFNLKNTTIVNTFVTQKGLKVVIPPNAFKTRKNVQIKVKEAFTKAEIAQSGLNTRCGNRILESEGMFQITAFAGGKAIALDPKVGIKIHFPRISEDTSFKLFVAQPDRNGIVTNWNLTNIDATTEPKKPECPEGDEECFRCKTILKDYYRASKDTIPYQYFIINRDKVSLVSLRPVEEQLFNIAVKNKNLSFEEQKHQFEMNTLMFEPDYEKRSQKFKFLYAVHQSQELAPNVKKSQMISVLRSYIDREVSLPRDHPIPYKGRSKGANIISMISEYPTRQSIFNRKVNLKHIQNLKITGNGDSLIVRFAAKRSKSKYQWGLHRKLWMYSKNNGSMMVYADSSRFCECDAAYPNYYRKMHSFAEQIEGFANVYQLSRLGWYNIDRFYNLNQEILTFKGKIEPDDQEQKLDFTTGKGWKIHVISERNNIHLLGTLHKGGTFSFDFFSGEAVKILIRNEDYVGVWEGTLKENTLPTVKLKQISREKITELFAGL